MAVARSPMAAGVHTPLGDLIPSLPAAELHAGAWVVLAE